MGKLILREDKMEFARAICRKEGYECYSYGTFWEEKYVVRGDVALGKFTQEDEYEALIFDAWNVNETRDEVTKLMEHIALECDVDVTLNLTSVNKGSDWICDNLHRQFHDKHYYHSFMDFLRGNSGKVHRSCRKCGRTISYFEEPAC